MYHYHVPLAEVGEVPMDMAWGLMRVLPQFTGMAESHDRVADFDRLLARAEKLGVRARS